MPDKAAGLPGSRINIEIERQNYSASPHSVSLSVENLPRGWTATFDRTSLLINPRRSPRATLSIDIPAGEPIGGLGRLIDVVGTDAEWRRRVYYVSITVGANLSTGITKLTNSRQTANGVFVSDFRVTNGPDRPIVRPLRSPFVPGVLSWFRPTNETVISVNVERDYQLCSIATDSNQAGPYDVTATFEKNAIEFSYTTQFSIVPSMAYAFKIEPNTMVLSYSSVGAEARFDVTVDLPPGNAGDCELTFANLGPGVSPIVTPPSHTISPAGDPVPFVVLLRRTAANLSGEETTIETLIRGRHSTKAETNFDQVVPIYAMP